MTRDAQPAGKPKRRWYQFSLRTLLIGTAAIAAFLAVGLRWVAPAQRQRAAVEMVKRLNGTVIYADAPANETWTVTKLRDWLPRDYFDAVVTVALHHSAVGDNEIDRLVGLTQLQRLHITHATAVTDVGLVHIVALKQLEELILAGTHITDAGLIEPKRLAQLQWINLNDAQITDAGLIHLGRLPKLRGLELAGTQVTDAGLIQLEGLKQLQWLELERTPVTDAGVAELQQALPNCQIVR